MCDGLYVLKGMMMVIVVFKMVHLCTLGRMVIGESKKQLSGMKMWLAVSYCELFVIGCMCSEGRLLVYLFPDTYYRVGL
ncbi:hypothetical protein [Vibrio cionasavignyae]|uniref:hypothetical protein n=1 Tax=Vibrio cionasavignyae TaxID=2910252 RepID=UPI003D0D3CDD